MTRMKPKYSTNDPELNARRLLVDGARLVAMPGGGMGLIVPDSMRDYDVPDEKKIIGYTGDAEQLCIECVTKGWAQNGETAEQALTRAALEMGVDRSDERNYDSAELPKPLTIEMIEGPQQCGGCWQYFGYAPEDFRVCPDDNCPGFVTSGEGPGTCVNCGKEYDDEDFENTEEQA